jgi:hypothetical protein
LTAIDVAGLELDAELRRELMLQRQCRSFPLAFSVSSALENGLQVLRSLIDLEHVQAPAHLRSARFGDALRTSWQDLAFASERERMLCGAILDAERSLAWAAAHLREALLDERELQDDTGDAPANWHRKPLTWAPFVCMTMVPRSLSELKRQLCPCAPDALWARLGSAALPQPRLTHVLSQEDPRLLVARAVVVHSSRCEADVTHRVMELPGGFGPMLQHVNGKASTEELLGHLARASAPPQLLKAVQSGMQKLVEEGMLRLGET